MPTQKNGKWKMPKESSIRVWKNTSEFPDSWARPTIEWLCELYRVPAVGVKIWNAKKRRGSGCANLDSNEIHLSISRRKYRRDWKYWSIYWDRQRTANSACEAFVFLAAHEVAHISYEGKRIWKTCQEERVIAGKNDWRKRMEMKIQDMAQNALNAYRAGVRKCLLAHHIALVRRTRAVDRAKVEKKRWGKTPEARVLSLKARIEAWDSKRRRAENAIKKLNRSISGIMAAQKRAAMQSGSVSL